jgi:endonuclease/exonuclease/phosphatase family metal-dependent hydrolase
MSSCIGPHLPGAADWVADDDDGPHGCEQPADAGPLALICPKTRACDPRAPLPRHVRVVSWNIEHGAEHGIDAVADQLHALEPDVVLLQEVDRDVERSGVIDEAHVVAAALGPQYQAVFAPTLELEGGLYGISIVSRVPFRGVGVIPLSNTDVGEPRTAIDARLCVGPLAMRVVNHHADYLKDGAAISLQEILQVLQSSPVPGTVFAGDFNQDPSDTGPEDCVDSGLSDVLATRDPGPTFATNRIDYFFVDDLLIEHVAGASVVQSDDSDHRPIMMDLALRPNVKH